MSALLDKTIPVLLLAIMVFAALAHGAVEPLSVALCSAGIIAVLLLWVLKAALDRQLLVNLPAPACPFVCLIALGAAQSVVWTDQAGRRMSLSLDVEDTRQTVLLLSLLLIAFLAAANFFVTHERLTALVNFLIIYGLALALFSLIQYALWDGSFYWVRYISTAEITSPFGPFVHHGHYAGYIELLLPLPIAMLVLRRAPRRRRFLYHAAPFDAHCTPLNIAATLGLPALLAFAALPALLWRHSQRPPQLAIWSGLLGLGLDALGQDSEDFRHLWVLLGLAGSWPQLRDNQNLADFTSRASSAITTRTGASCAFSAEQNQKDLLGSRARINRRRNKSVQSLIEARDRLKAL